MENLNYVAILHGFLERNLLPFPAYRFTSSMNEGSQIFSCPLTHENKKIILHRKNANVIEHDVSRTLLSLLLVQNTSQEILTLRNICEKY